MPALSKNEAAERLAAVIQNAKPTALAEIFAELFPEKPAPPSLSASELALDVRSGLDAEEIVDLWNVVFPADRNVWYDEEEDQIRYNDEAIIYSE